MSEFQDTISYEGIDEAVLVHALYHGTQPLGMGFFQNIDGLTLDMVRAELMAAYPRAEFGIPVMDLPNRESDGTMYFDYYHGRPLKVHIDMGTKTFRAGLYDRDAGDGAAQRVVDRLRREAA